jgi:hypothetical protein
MYIIINQVLLKGKFEMKNKNLIEEDMMFCCLEFKDLPKKKFDYANLIKVCVKTNGNIMRITLNNNFSYVETLVTKVV